jgi:biotin synthase
MSQVTELFNKPLLDLLFEAQQVHRQHFDPRQVQVSTLLSIKTGACPEDCKYCPQSARYKTGLESERLMEVEQVLESARKAKKPVQPASAWARRGRTRTIAICRIWSRW